MASFEFDELLGALTPFAGAAGTAIGGPLGGAVAGGLFGMLSAKKKREEMLRQAKIAADKEARMTEVSWAAKDGKGQITKHTPYDKTAVGDLGEGALGGMGMALGKDASDGIDFGAIKDAMSGFSNAGIQKANTEALQKNYENQIQLPAQYTREDMNAKQKPNLFEVLSGKQKRTPHWNDFADMVSRTS